MATNKIFKCCALLLLASVFAAVHGANTVGDVITKVGDDIHFMCSFENPNNENFELVWYTTANDGRQGIFKYTKNDPSQTFKYDAPELNDRTIESADDGMGLIIKGAKLTDNEFFKTVECSTEVGRKSDSGSANLLVVSYPPQKGNKAPRADLSNGGRFTEGNKNIGSCSTGYGYPQPTLEFLKDGAVVESETDGGDGDYFGFESSDIDEVDEDGSVRTKRDLFLNLGENDDKSVIACRITTGKGDFVDVQVIKMGEIRVEHEVSKVAITASKAGPYVEGDSVQFNCSHNGFPESYIESFGLSSDLTESSPSRTIVMSSDLDQQAVICKAKIPQQASAVVKDYLLDVNFNKDVVVSGATTVKLGEKVDLKCASAAKPEATLIWRKDGSEVEGGATLTLDSADFSSRGTYTCESVNSVGSAVSSEHALDVTGLKLTSKSAQDVATTDLEAGIKMTCKAEASGKPTFAWSQMGEKKAAAVEEGEKLMIESTEEGTMYSSTLTVKEATAALSMAKFMCDVSLGADSQTATFTLGEIKEKSSSAGIIVGILVLILIILIVLALLYYKGIICKKEGKSGEETADDIEVEIRKDEDVESGAVEGEKLLENETNE